MDIYVGVLTKVFYYWGGKMIHLVALVASLGKACQFLKFCSKRNKFKVDGFLACVCRYT